MKYTLWLLVIFQIICHSFGAPRNKFAVFSVPTENTSYVALTFDDGPHQMLTPKLLDIFKEKNAKASFFVMGVKVGLHPEIVQRALREGHDVCNHAWNHPVLAKISYEDVSQQLQSTNQAIFNATKYIPHLMRPPYGNTNPKLNEYMQRQENLTAIMWSLDTNDWKRPNPNELIRKTLSRVKAGDIILCHDIHPGTINAMPALIDGLHAKGFKLVTVSTMLQAANDVNAAVGSRRLLRGIGGGDH